MNNIESYKHKSAKEILSKWLASEYTTRTEVPFFIDKKLSFIPDVVCYDDLLPFAFWEIVHKSEISSKKLGRIQAWSYINQIPVGVYEIQAEWILTRIEQPKELKYLNYTIEM